MGSLIISCPVSNDQWVTLHIYLKGCLIISFPMTNRAWGHCTFFWKAISSSIPMTNRQWVRIYVFLSGSLTLPTAGESHATFSWISQQIVLWPGICEWHSTLIWKAVTSHLNLWPTVCECHCTMFWKLAVSLSCFITNRQWVTFHICRIDCHHILSYNNRMWVIVFYIMWKAPSSHLVLWPTVCEWHQTVLWKASSPHLVPWLTVCEWHCTFYERHLITSCPMTNRLWVTLDIFLTGSLITSYPMTTRKWVILYLYERQSHHNLLHDQIASEQYYRYLWKAAHHIGTTGSAWHSSCTFVWRAVSSHLVVLPTDSESHCTFLWKEVLSHLSSDQQGVSDVTHSMKGCLTTSCPMINRK